MRGRWSTRPRRRLRAPAVGLLLSLLVLLSPELTLAPTSALEPHGSVPVAIELLDLSNVPAQVQPIDVASAPTPGPGPSPPAPPPAPPEATLPGVDAAAYAAAVEAARAKGEAYGITFAAVRDGEVLWTGASGRARDGVTPLDAAQPLVIGSVTKTFVAATVLQLAEEGRLGLSDTVRSHLPGEGAVTPDITIRQLLDHTSGLADVFNDTTRVGIETHPEHAWGASELMATLHAPWYRPGEGYAYANTNYYLLGLVIEKVTGHSLADELQARFVGPLGLESTRMLTAQDERGPLEPAWATIFWGSGAMSASAADLARWGDALYGDALLGDASRAEMLKFRENDYSNAYGLGAQRIEVPGAVGHGHTGMLKTYTSLLLHLPAQNVTLALLVNRTHVDLGAMLAAKPPSGPSILELAGVQVPAATPTPTPSAAPLP